MKDKEFKAEREKQRPGWPGSQAFLLIPPLNAYIYTDGSEVVQEANRLQFPGFPESGIFFGRSFLSGSSNVRPLQALIQSSPGRHESEGRWLRGR